ncbi:MAG: 5-(carboxyamino)imidazole ribonucleotide synthase [Ardenticatenaceae bacterium]|nr:5-(carboxyamino)imidazole ribonucleotide synthase [Anaerolineales bacterium]MCB8922237.1 5-(carboxyamino)imidazole ribonucleotide synthase [Ardenticatenaceae bacterium]MCB8990578.1 5-(carboxyamino)imidazole ribonucleotide synthase [Ardenticatenaceae bacterium]
MSNKILPPATIGILGSGQLGRMLTIAARQMGYRIHVLSPDSDSPTGQIADKEFAAAYEDLDAVQHFAQSVDVVTYEFENVPTQTAVACQEFAPLRPGANVLHVAQNRLREKQFFVAQGLPTAPFAEVTSLETLLTGLEKIGTPAILKTATSGYDGKGQVLIANGQSPMVNRQPSIANRQSLAANAWEAIHHQPAILEGFVEFEREVSMVAARGLDGSFAHYGQIENSHVHHILDISQAPADVPPGVTQEAVRLTRAVLEGLDVVGVLCVEFFLLGNGRLLLNEIAPRPHNSGHLTIEACVTSQFEQQLRAICGLPLGSTRYLRAAAMANLLGDLWFPANDQQSEPSNHPDWTAVLTHPHVKLHLYGKAEARPGRKMGHITALANIATEAATIVREARAKLNTEY